MKLAFMIFHRCYGRFQIFIGFWCPLKRGTNNRYIAGLLQTMQKEPNKYPSKGKKTNSIEAVLVHILAKSHDGLLQHCISRTMGRVQYM